MMLRLFDVILVFMIAGSFVVAALAHFDVWEPASLHTLVARVSADADAQQDSADPNSKAATEARARPAPAPAPQAREPDDLAHKGQSNPPHLGGNTEIATANAEDRLLPASNEHAHPPRVSLDTVQVEQESSIDTSPAADTDATLGEAEDDAPNGEYYVQLMSLSTREGADVAATQLAIGFADVLQDRNISVSESDESGRSLFLVRAGPFRTRADSRRACDEIERRGGDCFLVSIEPESSVENNDVRPVPSGDDGAEAAIGQDFITTTRLNYRGGPSTTASKYGVLPKETVVRVLFDDANWARVRLQGGQEAYVAREFIQPLE